MNTYEIFCNRVLKMTTQSEIEAQELCAALGPGWTYDSPAESDFDYLVRSTHCHAV